MQFTVESKRRNLETLKAHYADAQILDLTSKGPQPWIKFSPFFPHGNIPVPFMPGTFAESVEGIWQGLKVFENADIDVTKFSNGTMKNLKRSVRTNGKVLGHRAGDRLLSYREARSLIYLPVYRWVVDNYLQAEIETLKNLSASQKVVFLDYETNDNIENLTSPLSHAALVVRYVEDRWPV